MAEKMTEEWVLFWYQCLSENLDYSEYCSARKRLDTATSQELEARFVMLPDLFRDFGPLAGWPKDGINNAEWRAWFEPRRGLFMQSVVEFEPGEIPAPIDGHVFLKVPLQSSAQVTAELVREYLSRLYSSEAPKPTNAPKYQLHMRGNRVACGYQQVRHAVHTSTVSYAMDPVTYEYLPIRQVILNFLRGELTHMGWSISDESRQQLMQEGRLDEDTLENFKVQINKCRRDFKALSQNTIRGRFPDTTPYPDSRVIDQFWGE